MNSDKSNHWTELHTAAKSGDAETLSRLIRDGANLDAVTKLDWTPLHFAAKYGYLACCRLLAEAGASMILPTRLRFFTPVHIAALEGHTDVVRLFLEHGADINARTAEGWTPLHAAVEHAHRDTVRFLLERGADPNLAKRTALATFPLHSAARNGRMDIVQLLVDHGTEINVRNKYGKTPRDFAEESGFYSIVHFFDSVADPVSDSSVITCTKIRERIRQGDLEWIKQWQENGAPCSSKYFSSPLIEACIDGQTEIVRYLLETGTKADSGSCWTPLYFMLMSHRVKNRDIITLLLEHGADPCVRDAEGITISERWKTENPSIPLELLEELESHGVEFDRKWKNTAALRWAVKTRNHVQAEALLKDGADPNEANGYGIELPLRVAVENSDTDMVRLLLEHDANPNQKVPFEDTILSDAAENGNLEIVVMLVEAGALVNRKTDTGSPIKAALRKGHEEIVDYLLRHGADIESRTTRLMGKPVDSSSTPIFAALESGRTELVRKMVDKGVDLTMIGDYGNTLLHAAVNSGMIEWVRFFIEQGLKIDAKNNWKQTPLHTAASKREKEIEKLLMDSGASVEPPETFTPLFYAIMIYRNDLLEEALQRNPADASRACEAHSGDLWHKTPLVVALEYDNFEAVEILLRYGASITGAKITTHQEGAWGESALSYVSRRGMKEMLKRFLQEEININSKAAVVPALHSAASVEIAQILLNHGANPYLRSNEHRTALECQLRNKEVADFLRKVMSREPAP